MKTIEQNPTVLQKTRQKYCFIKKKGKLTK